MKINMKEIFEQYNNLQNKQYNKNIKIGLFRSYSIESIEKPLFVTNANKGFCSEFIFGTYGQYMQEAMEQKNEIYSSDVIIVSISIEDLPIKWRDVYLTCNVNEFCENTIEYMKNLIDIIKSNTNKPILVTGFVNPIEYTEFSYDFVSPMNVDFSVNKINISLCEYIYKLTNVYFLDIKQLINNIGYEESYDIKMWKFAKNPYKPTFYYRLSEFITKTISTIFTTRKKCVVLDLDNTLWQGVIGEDGVAGLRLNEFNIKLQKYMLHLKKSGILLCICSKNNMNDAILGFTHKDMVLQEDDFIIKKINWENKDKNILDISTELNIGLDSIVFFDDNIIECEIVSQNLKDVTTVCVKKCDINEVYAVEGLDFLDVVKEDLIKTELYKTNIQRNEFINNFDNVDDYLKSLNMSLKIYEINENVFERAVQLTNKTNQFNLTTKRYDKSDFEELINKNNKIFIVENKDKFGDNGIVGLFILNLNDGYIEIDTFLLSCRVLKRNIEYKVINFILKYAKKLGANSVHGKYISTTKNKPCEDLYIKSGFKYNTDEDIWVFNLDKEITDIEYIALEI